MLHRLLIFCLLLNEIGALLNCSAINRNHIDDNEYRIVNGYRPRLSTLTKYLVSIRLGRPKLYEGDNHYCGGVIISPKSILTAAHCVTLKRPAKATTDTFKLRVAAGAPMRFKHPVTAQLLKVSSVISHGNFSWKNISNDVAILRLQRSIKLDSKTKASIALADKPPFHGMSCTVLGWGQLFLNGPLVDEALHVDLQIRKDHICDVLTNYDPSMLCAHDTIEQLKDACKGDSGGPLICNEKLYGIVSWGVDCAHPFLPSVFANVYHLRDWIVKNGTAHLQFYNFLILILITLIIIAFI